LNQLRFGGREGSWAGALAAAMINKINNANERFMGGLISKRCKSCQTLYQSPMKAALASILLALLATVPCSARERHCTFRIHAQGNAKDGAVFSSAIRSQFSGKQVAIEKTPRISEHDVVAFYPYPAEDGSYGVLIQLNDHGKLALDTLSIDRRGSFLFVFVNGRPITELQIDKRVSDGQIYLPSGLGLTDLERMRKDWRVIGQRKK
jgi:hypothetical protein